MIMVIPAKKSTSADEKRLCHILQGTKFPVYLYRHYFRDDHFNSFRQERVI
jgi:hypothetical protein